MTTEELAVWFAARICGCGDPEEAAKTLLRMLEGLAAYAPVGVSRQIVPDEGARYLLLYWLDHEGLTEHGGSVDGSWLTDLGRDLEAALRVECDRDEFVSLFESRCSAGVLVEDPRHENGGCACQAE